MKENTYTVKARCSNCGNEQKVEIPLREAIWRSLFYKHCNKCKCGRTLQEIKGTVEFKQYINKMGKMTKKEALQKIKELEAYINQEGTVIQKIPAKILEWGAISNEELNWDDAKKWCQEQGKGWRLPTKIELIQACGYGIEGFETDYYWSSTEYNTYNAWYVYFSNGNTGSNNKTNNSYVRCVREVK